MTKKSAALLSLILLLAAAAHAQNKRPMTYEDILALKQVGGAQISPDGERVIYTLSSVDLKENERRTEIWMARADRSAPPRRFTSGRQDTSPQWSPDGEWIAFLSTRAVSAPPAGGASGPAAGPRPQIYLISPFGGEAEKLTDAKTGVTAFVWSPDSKRIAFISQAPLNEAEEKRQKERDDAQVVDANFRFTRLSVIDLGSRKATEIVKGDFVISDPQWSPDGRQLSYTANPTPKPDDGSLSDIYLVGADGGAPRKLYENDGPDAGARWSPDGRWISFSSRDGRGGLLGQLRLQIIPASGGAPRTLIAAFDNSIPPVVWSRDGRTLYFSTVQGTQARIFAAGLPLDPGGGAIKTISRGEGVISGFTLSRAGDRVAYTRTDPLNPAEIYVSPLPNFKESRLTDHNPQIKELALGRAEVVRWKSRDGMEIEGLIILPVGYEPGRRYPLIANIHGGPAGVWTQAFPGTHGNYAHIWAGRGWVTFLPNVRGSSGYGEKFQLANLRDWGGGDYQDIQTGIDHLVQRGLADPERMGQTGWSYGGYMTAWTLTQTNRFKAVMVGAGLTNMFSMYGTNDLQRTLEGYFGATPWDDLEAYQKASAMSFIKQARTPTLILHGAQDQRVPIGQAQELYMGLRKRGVPVQLVFYPREGHGLQEPRHQLDKMKREYAWFARYVLGQEIKDEPVASARD